MELWDRVAECCYLQAIPHGTVDRRSLLGASLGGAPQSVVRGRFKEAARGGKFEPAELEADLALEIEFELDRELDLKLKLELGLELDVRRALQPLHAGRLLHARVPIVKNAPSSRRR